MRRIYWRIHRRTSRGECTSCSGWPLIIVLTEIGLNPSLINLCSLLYINAFEIHPGSSEASPLPDAKHHTCTRKRLVTVIKTSWSCFSIKAIGWVSYLKVEGFWCEAGCKRHVHINRKFIITSTTQRRRASQCVEHCGFKAWWYQMKAVYKEAYYVKCLEKSRINRMDH